MRIFMSAPGNNYERFMSEKKPPDSLIIFFMSKWPQKIVQVELKDRSEGSERSYADASYTAYARIMSKL